MRVHILTYITFTGLHRRNRHKYLLSSDMFEEEMVSRISYLQHLGIIGELEYDSEQRHTLIVSVYINTLF